MIGGDTMEIKCPYCGSVEYECFDRVGDGTMTPKDLCVCENCDKQFSIIYAVDCIVKES
jgi:sarcosine oxidase delta subunit